MKKVEIKMIYKVLEIINQEGFVTVHELSKKLGLDDDTVKSIIELLQSRNLVQIFEKNDAPYKICTASVCQFCPLKRVCNR